MMQPGGVIRGIATDDHDVPGRRSKWSSASQTRPTPRTSLPSIVNRILLPMITRRSSLYEGVGNVERSTTAMRARRQPTMGPRS